MRASIAVLAFLALYGTRKGRLGAIKCRPDEQDRRGLPP